MSDGSDWDFSVDTGASVDPSGYDGGNRDWNFTVDTGANLDPSGYDGGGNTSTDMGAGLNGLMRYLAALSGASQSQASEGRPTHISPQEMLAGQQVPSDAEQAQQQRMLANWYKAQYDGNLKQPSQEQAAPSTPTDWYNKFTGQLQQKFQDDPLGALGMLAKIGIPVGMGLASFFDKPKQPAFMAQQAALNKQLHLPTRQYAEGPLYGVTTQRLGSVTPKG